MIRRRSSSRCSRKLMPGSSGLVAGGSGGAAVSSAMALLRLGGRGGHVLSGAIARRLGAVPGFVGRGFPGNGLPRDRLFRRGRLRRRDLLAPFLGVEVSDLVL